MVNRIRNLFFFRFLFEEDFYSMLYSILVGERSNRVSLEKDRIVRSCWFSWSRNRWNGLYDLVMTWLVGASSSTQILSLTSDGSEFQVELWKKKLSHLSYICPKYNWGLVLLTGNGPCMGGVATGFFSSSRNRQRSMMLGSDPMHPLGLLLYELWDETPPWTAGWPAI